MITSAIITAAGQNRRMREDLEKKGLPLKNKLILEIKGKPLLQHTIRRVLNVPVDECIVVVGHYQDEILPAISNIHDPRLKIIKNNPVDVPLAQSLYNGLKSASGDICLCVAGDQPTVKSNSLRKLKDKIINSDKADNMVSILGRKTYGHLDSAEGLGMPFASSRNLLLDYLPHYKSNLNPMLRKMFKEGVEFYGFPPENKLELININHYKDYELILNDFKEE
ncbi:NTP transferase domain-containing protein [Methanobacterium movens]